MGASSVSTPPPPDPTPTPASDTTEEVRGAARTEQKRVAAAYGRKKTIIAGLGANSQTNTAKKTILGG